MTIIFNRFVKEKLELEEDASLEKIKAAMNKDTLKDEIIEGFDIYILIK